MFMHTNIHEHILVHKSIFKQFKIDFIPIISFQFHFFYLSPSFQRLQILSNGSPQPRPIFVWCRFKPMDQPNIL